MTKAHDLRVAPQLKLNDNITTLTIAVLGNRGSGKTNTGVVITEDLLELGHQVVVIDPLDVWWGLKSSADGKAPGYPVIVLGGPHGDVPLADTDGRVIADFVVESRLPVILSLRHVSKAGQRRFMADFAEQIYKRKGESGRNTPCLFVIDEASSFVPQRVGPDETRMLGALEDWVRRGRASGIGVTLIDQRAASVNKDVLTQIELLVAHRHTSPQDRKALQEWVRGHDVAGQEATFMESLASLKQGEAWFWSPNWLDLFQRVQVRPRRTYDSSKTPERGLALPAPKAAAEVDLVALKAQLTKTIEQARENDPKALKAEIAALKKQAQQLQAARPAAAGPAAERVVEKTVYIVGKGSAEEALESAIELLTKATDLLEQAQREVKPAIERVAKVAGEISAAVQQARQLAAAPASQQKPNVGLLRTPAAPRPATPAREGVPTINGPQLRILDALAWLHSVGLSPANRTQLALLADASPTSSAYTNNLGSLRTQGLITYPSAGTVALTPDGHAQATAPETTPTTAALQAQIFAKLGPTKAALLKAIIRAHPGPIARELLAEHVGASATSSAFTNNLGALRSLGLIDYPEPGWVIALPVLFIE